MTDSTDRSPTALRIERTDNAPAQAVFEAWTNPEVMRRWWHAGGADWENSHAEADLRVGGTVRVVMRDPRGKTYGGGGEYTEIRPPGRLAFTWSWDDAVVLTHSGLASEESQKGHREGWQDTLNHLARVLEA
jgi:uncharacterized protein YndB with AHSA1/START domain